MSEIAEPRPDVAAEGFADARLEPVRALFHEHLASGAELGASLVVIQRDRVLADLWGGHADPERTAPWHADTITNVWSLTKTVSALAVLLLVDRGLLDLDRPVADVWPEFGTGGKEGVTLRALMRHTSGLAGWDPPIAVTDLYDLEGAAARLAAQEAWFAPGGESGYQIIAYGHLLGEIVRRVDGRTLGAFVADELADPLGADFWIGLPESEEERVSLVVPPGRAARREGVPNPPRPAPGSIAQRAFTGPLLAARDSWPRAWRAAGLGGAGGTANARAVARIGQLVAQGGTIEGERMLRADTIAEILRDPTDGVDLVLGLPLRFGLGFAAPHPETTPWLPQDGRIAFWGGWGGALLVCDQDRELTIAYVMNRMSPGIVGSERSDAYVRAVYDALG